MSGWRQLRVKNRDTKILCAMTLVTSFSFGLAIFRADLYPISLENQDDLSPKNSGIIRKHPVITE
jgi:hypothetical protein